MGGGKTLFATLYALLFSQKRKNSKIFANFRLKLENFRYIPYLFMPFSELENGLLIVDDIYGATNAKQFITVIVNYSRKINLHIILTAQYYTMIPPLIRTVSNYIVSVKFIQINGVDLLIAQPDKPNSSKIITLNPIKKVGKIYDTTEIVPIITEKQIRREILNNSPTKDDLELNIACYTSSYQRQRKIYSDLLPAWEKRYE